MVSLPDDSIKTQTAPLENLATPAKPKAAWTTQVNTEQVFRLIDSILPFEACLYHQLLPLSLEGSRLKLGMVNLEDTAALDYVRRILAYMNCSLVPQTLATDVHHAVLSAYLSYTGSQKQPLSRPTTARAIAQHTGQRLHKDAAKKDASDANSDASTKANSGANSGANIKANAGAIDAAPSHVAEDSNPTFLVDSPEDLNFQDLDIAAPPAPPAVVVPSVIASAPTSAPGVPAEARSTEARSTDPRSTDPQALPSVLAAQETTIQEQETLEQPPDASQLRETLILKLERSPAKSKPSELSTLPEISTLPESTLPDLSARPEIPTPGDALPILPVEPKHLSEPITALATLPPAELVVELLGRLLVGGIGRLYFERQSQSGRVLWSQNGVLQSVLEELPLDVIQGAVNELKLLTHLPLIPVQKPKQVEIERRYQKHRLLLRLRVMPGIHGEEATVQVLRGAALKFYQQQQLASLSRDALTIAQELQRKVNEIRVRTRFYPLSSPDQLSILPALNQVIKSVEQELEALRALQATTIEEERDEG